MLVLVCCGLTHSGNRFTHTLDDRARKHEERPNCCNAHGTCTDETHLLLVDCPCKFLHCHAVGKCSHIRKVRHEAHPSDENTDEHRKAARNANEIASAEKRRRIAERQLLHAAPHRKPCAKAVTEYMKTIRQERDDPRNAAA